MSALEEASTEGVVAIGVNRRKLALIALGFTGLLAYGLHREFSAKGHMDVGLLMLAIIGPFVFAVARVVWRNKPALLIDGEGLTDCRSGTHLAWHEIVDLHAHEYQTAYNLEHTLVITAALPSLVEERWLAPRRWWKQSPSADGRLVLVLDSLSLGWEDVVSVVQSKSKRLVPIRRSSRLARRARRRSRTA